jgi:hypothetical protein
MAISLSDLQTVRADKPPRVLLYGPPKIGKTTLAAEFPAPVYIQTEEGTPKDLEIVSFGNIGTFSDVLDAIAALYSEDHNFRTLVVDSLSALEPMVWRETCQRNGWTSIETPGYGKGYVEADLVWQEFITAVTSLRRDKNMGVVLIAHSEIKRIEDPIVGPLDRYLVQLHKRAVDIIHKDVDIIAFVNYRISVQETKGAFNKTHRKGVGAGERIIHFADRPGFMAGNRCGLPDEVPYRRGEGFGAIAEHLPGWAAEGRKPRAAKQEKEAA